MVLEKTLYLLSWHLFKNVRVIALKPRLLGQKEGRHNDKHHHRFSVASILWSYINHTFIISITINQFTTSPGLIQADSKKKSISFHIATKCPRMTGELRSHRFLGCKRTVVPMGAVVLYALTLVLLANSGSLQLSGGTFTQLPLRCSTKKHGWTEGSPVISKTLLPAPDYLLRARAHVWAYTSKRGVISKTGLACVHWVDCKVLRRSIVG